jgi:integrase-like protein
MSSVLWRAGNTLTHRQECHARPAPALDARPAEPVGFRKSAAGLARGAHVNVSGVRGPVLVGEVLVDELDGSGVFTAVAAELAAKRVVELVDVDAVEPAVVGDVPLERFHRTLKDWLSDEPAACDLPELQALLDRFRAHYNEERPHQGIGDRTTGERYRSPAEEPLAELDQLAEAEERRYPQHAIVRKVKSTGVFSSAVSRSTSEPASGSRRKALQTLYNRLRRSLGIDQALEVGALL